MNLPAQQEFLIPRPTQPTAAPADLAETDQVDPIEERPHSLCERVTCCLGAALAVFCACLDACEEAGRELPPGTGMP